MSSSKKTSSHKSAEKKVRPNILITGTPGVGKTKICVELEKRCEYRFLEVSTLAKENNFTAGYDEELECPIMDEDKTMDYLEPIMAKGGNILEYHCCDFFPERWFQAVYVIRCDNTILYDRLKRREYNEQKIKNNIECEIFMEILNEAKESYEPSIVMELRGDNSIEFEKSVDVIQKFIEDKENWQ